MRRHLVAAGGDNFTLFPSDGEPTVLDCAGSVDERTRCVFAALDQRAHQTTISGAIVATTADGVRRSVAYERGRRTTNVTPRTRLPAASVTKMFVAAAAVSLSQRGALDLQRPVATYLPELSLQRGVGRASVHQLLTHTAGLPNPPQCTEDNDIGDLVQQEGNHPLWAPPGAVFSYSNLGYTVVGAVLEAVTHQPFEQVVEERVLEPVGIADASFDAATVELAPQPPKGAPPTVLCRAALPSGGLVLSTEDLARWGHDLASSSPALGSEVVGPLTAPHVATGLGPGQFYGYGVYRREIAGVTILSHGGGLVGYSSFVGWVPERQFSVAAMANANGGAPTGASLLLLSTVLGIPANRPADPTPSHPLSDYAGTYVDRFGDLKTLVVSLEDDQLVIDYPEGKPKLLPPTFRFTFSASGRPAQYVVTAAGIGQRVR